MPVQVKQSNESVNRDLERQIVVSLNAHHVQSLRNVKVAVSDGVVRLRGEVNTFYAKQLSQHCASRLAGENQIVDEVTVARPSAFRDPLRLRRSAAAGVALLLLALAVGCSNKQEPARVAVHPVTGQVIYKGKPAAGAWIVFHPKGESNFPAPKAKVDSQGNFKLSTYEPNDGAPAGEYAVTLELLKVTVTNGDMETGPNVFPPKYSSPARTVLTARVTDGSNSVPIKVR